MAPKSEFPKRPKRNARRTGGIQSLSKGGKAAEI